MSFISADGESLIKGEAVVMFFLGIWLFLLLIYGVYISVRKFKIQILDAVRYVIRLSDCPTVTVPLIHSFSFPVCLMTLLEIELGGDE